MLPPLSVLPPLPVAIENFLKDMFWLYRVQEANSPDGELTEEQFANFEWTVGELIADSYRWYRRGLRENKNQINRVRVQRFTEALKKTKQE